jgi:hypothetical protein
MTQIASSTASFDSAADSGQPRNIGATSCAATVCALIIVSVVLALQPEYAPAHTLPSVLPLLLAWIGVTAFVVGDGEIRRAGRLGWILLSAFGVSVILALVHHSVFWPEAWAQYRQGATLFDAFLYADYAKQWAEHGLRGDGPWNGINYQGIVFYYALLFYIFGFNPAVGVIANCALGALTAGFLYKLVHQCSPESVAYRAAVLFAFLPESILWGSLLLKESLVTFLFVFALHEAAVAVRTMRTTPALLAVLAVALLLQFRIVLAVVAIVSIAAMIVLVYRRSLGRLALASAALILLAAIVTRFSTNTLIAAYGNPLSPAFYAKYIEVFGARPPEANAAIPGSSLGIMTSGALTEGKFYWIPVRFAMYYIVPPPWATGLGSFDPFRMASAALVWAALPAMCVGLFLLLRRGAATAAIWIPFLFGSVLISASTPFIDDRLRMMMMPLFLAAAAWGWHKVAWWWRIYPLVILTAGVGSACFYLFKSGL